MKLISKLINGLKQLKNLSIPQRLIRAMIIKLFQAKIKNRCKVYQEPQKHKQ